MEKYNKKIDFEIDITYEEWVSGGKYRYAKDIYTNHGNGD